MDQRVDFDSKEAPQKLRLMLLEENPKWKVPERKVARYLKKQLKARNNPKAEEIDADIDEETTYTNISKQTTRPLGDSHTAVPSSIVCIPEDDCRKEATSVEEQTIKGNEVEQETIQEVVAHLESENNEFLAEDSARMKLNREMQDMCTIDQEIAKDDKEGDNELSPNEQEIAKIDEEGGNEVSPTDEKIVEEDEKVDSHLQKYDANKYYTDDNDEQEGLEKNCFNFNFIVIWCR